MAIHFGPKIMSNVRIRYCDPSAFLVRYRADNGGGAGGCGKKASFKIPPESYITYLEGRWLRHPELRKLKDYFAVFNWISEKKPLRETNSLSYLLHSLSCIHPYIKNRDLKKWCEYIKPYEHYISSDGSWLRSAKDLEFKDSIQPIKWLVTNRPENEKNKMSFLLNCLRLENKTVKENHLAFAVYANAYDYIANKVPARNELTGTLLSFIGEGKRPEEITVKMMEKKMDVMRFTWLKNEGMYIQDPYLRTIITVYLHSWQNFVMK